MNRKQYLLTKLIEEASEVIQASTKILTFGENNYNPDTKVVNIDQLQIEVDDISAIIAMIYEEDMMPEDPGYVKSSQRIQDKKRKVNTYYELCKEIGTVQE